MLTGHQEKALQYASHVSVIANAGAGKTTVLVQRFVEILLRTGERVGSLAAITFTENAAGELRKRIAELIESRIRSSTSREERRLLERARDELSSANIGTIHSFCAQLLREYPVEAGVDAAFTVVEGVDRALLLKEALRDTLEAFLARDPSPRREDFTTAVRLIGRKRILSFLDEWLGKREVIERILAPGGPLSEDLSDEEVLRRRARLVEEEAAALVDEVSWREALRRLLAHAGERKRGDVEEILARWSDELRPDEKLRWYRELTDAVLTSDGKLRKGRGSNGFDHEKASEEDIATLAGHRKSLSGLFRDEAADGSMEGSGEGSGEGFIDGPGGGERILLKCIRVLLNVYRETVTLYSGRKEEFGLLDFDDLLVKARDLLQSEEIRRQLAAKLKFIMIDEYQDTDHLQYEIVRLLISNFTTGNLFIVGDPKQSIFSFRNAEVKIFEETRQAIEAASGPESEPTISLAESFRLLTGPVDFVNRVFSRTMKEGSSRFEISHHELIRGRANSADGQIELLLIPPIDMGEARMGAAELECRMVARKIAGLVADGATVYERGEETPRGARYSDIAILLRGRTRLEEMEKALAEARIPFILSGGIGFYQTQEVLDLLSFFKFLLNPDDDVALAAILRSPFFALSDSLLFELSRVRRPTLWEKLKELSGNRPGPILRRAVGILEEDLKVANRLPLPLLVHRIMLQTGWHGIISSPSSGPQQAANVRKLLRTAREFEGKGFHSLFDFVERLTILTDREAREGQALPEESDNCVRVMTVHAAKGLEFPIVFLPFLDRKFVYDDSPYIDASLGIAFEISSPSSPAQEIRSPYFELMKRQSRLKTEAEEKRILYVACTRARDMLLLSGRTSAPQAAPCYLDWVLRGLGLAPESLKEGEIVLPPKAVKTAGEAVMHALRVRVSVADPLREGTPLTRESGPPIPAADRKPPELWIAPVEARVHGEIFSATQIRTFLECPTKYYLKYVLGLPETGRAPLRLDEEDETDETGGGEVEGSITHLILRDIVDGSIEEREVEERVRRLVLDSYLVEPTQREQMARAVSRNVRQFVRSPFGKEVLSAPGALMEYSISCAFENDFLTGTIDRLYLNAPGERHVVDYKTDRITREELPKRAELYKPQLAVYAWMIRRLYRQERVRGSIVFLDHPSFPVHFEFGPDEIAKFEVLLRQSINRIKARDFDRSSATSFNGSAPTCETCTYITGRDCLIKSPSFSGPA